MPIKLIHKYTPKSELHYAFLLDCDSNTLGELDDAQCCEDCVDKMQTRLNMDLASGKFGDAVSVEITKESSPETEDYLTCCECGEYIETSVLHFTGQEISHWLKLSDIAFMGELRNNPSAAWLLNDLVESETVKFNYNTLQQQLIRKVNISALYHNYG